MHMGRHITSSSSKPSFFIRHQFTFNLLQDKVHYHASVMTVKLQKADKMEGKEEAAISYAFPCHCSYLLVSGRPGL